MFSMLYTCGKFVYDDRFLRSDENLVLLLLGNNGISFHADSFRYRKSRRVQSPSGFPLGDRYGVRAAGSAATGRVWVVIVTMIVAAAGLLLAAICTLWLKHWALYDLVCALRCKED